MKVISSLRLLLRMYVRRIQRIRLANSFIWEVIVSLFINTFADEKCEPSKGATKCITYLRNSSSSKRSGTETGSGCSVECWRGWLNRAGDCHCGLLVVEIAGCNAWVLVWGLLWLHAAWVPLNLKMAPISEFDKIMNFAKFQMMPNFRRKSWGLRVICTKIYEGNPNNLKKKKNKSLLVVQIASNPKKFS